MLMHPSPFRLVRHDTGIANIVFDGRPIIARNVVIHFVRTTGGGHGTVVFGRTPAQTVRHLGGQIPILLGNRPLQGPAAGVVVGQFASIRQVVFR